MFDIFVQNTKIAFKNRVHLFTKLAILRLKFSDHIFTTKPSLAMKHISGLTGHICSANETERTLRGLSHSEQMLKTSSKILQ